MEICDTLVWFQTYFSYSREDVWGITYTRAASHNLFGCVVLAAHSRYAVVAILLDGGYFTMDIAQKDHAKGTFSVRFLASVTLGTFIRRDRTLARSYRSHYARVHASPAMAPSVTLALKTY